MIYTTQNGQFSSGEAIGILLLETSVPFIPGDGANATTGFVNGIAVWQMALW